MKWQPIETAPKDGTRILLWDGEDIQIAGWDEVTMRGDKGWQISSVPGNDYVNLYEEVADPLHWCKLPDPPRGDPCSKCGRSGEDLKYNVPWWCHCVPTDDCCYHGVCKYCLEWWNASIRPNRPTLSDSPSGDHGRVREQDTTGPDFLATVSEKKHD